ncbi:cytochrome c [Flavihumibacter rivuli]|uniref:c-type cytochrome n=1 Tax=Flavihumibacter rivuli TaxID=2838156 RepID=UPI001BDE3891|nr:cytochrome c [Flavihumibacter rivuli]ULQ57250.1 cytochrome c [Flavihumibacter rivuli]
MKKKILTWLGVIILLTLTGVAIATGMRQHITYSAPLPDIHAVKDSAVIARGRHIVLGPGHCADCHSNVPGKDSLLKAGLDVPLTGGYLFDLPFGKFYTKNLTPDKETGIGSKSDPELARVIRYGVHADGQMVLPFMPFQHMADEDLVAVLSYLRSLKPVHNRIPENEYNLMGKMLKAFVLKPVGPTEKIPASVKADTSVAYGRYLSMVVANCYECHTQRDGVGNFIGEPMAGGLVFETPGKSTLVTPNLTPDSSSRIFGWSRQMFIGRFRMGKLIEHSHMPWAAFSRMSDDELTAIYNYLHTLKPTKMPKVEQ